MLPSTDHSNAFACLNLSANLLRQLERLNFHTPTPIQAEAIPHALEGKDVVGIAQTGTGKTLAFGLPMLQRLWDTDEVALVLAPTRELALQIDEELNKVGQGLGLKTAVLIGGAPMNRQIGDLRRRPNVIVATPGRLMDHLNQRTATLKFVTMVVLDEADRMFDMGFAPVVHRILDQVPTKRQTMLFSATMAPEVSDLAKKYLRNPVRVEVAPQGTASELIEQELHILEKEDKPKLLGELLEINKGTILVFSRTRHGARKVARNVRAMGHTAAELHSDRTLAQRKTALQGFKSGEYRVLVATDIAARGIDVKEIELVINYDLPDQIEDYIHRIGRTGRAGNAGRAVTFAMPDQHKDVRQIEKLLGRELPVMSGTLPPVTGGRPKFNRNGDPTRDRSGSLDKKPSRPPFEKPRDFKRDGKPSHRQATPSRFEKPRDVQRDAAAPGSKPPFSRFEKPGENKGGKSFAKGNRPPFPSSGKPKSKRPFGKPSR